MIKILISYFFILYISIGFGSIINKWIRLENYNILFTILCGFFFIGITSTFYAIVFPIDYYFFIINLIISTLFITIHFSKIKKIVINTKNSIIKFSTSSKFLFLFITLLSLIHSSSLPLIADNEFYYIQTIKWLNNYGLVKGLANLHLFLGQTSGWHLLQAGFNFNFIEPDLNDLNGFLVIMTSFFCIEKWEAFKITRNKNDLLISLIIVSLFFLFLFIASPSPDLPIIILIPIIIYFFLESFQNKKSNHINLITILTLLVFLIKVTISPVLILLLILLISSNDYKNWKFPIVMLFLTLSCFIIKNIVISGYPLFPLSIGNEIFNVNWKLNDKLQMFNYQWISMYGWQISNLVDFNNLDFVDKFWIWINLPRINGLLNKLIILLLILFPFFKSKKKEMLYLYIYFVVQFIIFYTTSPQYRYFLPIVLAISLILIVDLLYKKIIIIRFFVVLNLVLLSFSGIFGLNLDGMMNNNLMSKKYPFVPSQIISPRAISQFEDLKFIQYEIKNLKYYSPVEDSLFFWETFNGPLPSVNKKMIDYFSIHYNHIPQLRSKSIKNGFKSSKP